MTDKVKRTVLTPEQRVAKLEGELAAAKAKAEARANREANLLLEKRSKLSARISKLMSEIDDVDTQLARLGVEPEITISTDTEGTFV